MAEDESLRTLRRQAAALLASLDRQAGETPAVLFKDFAASYLAAKLLRPKLRLSTKRSFENQLTKHLIPRFGMLPLEKITNAIWLEWVTEAKGITKFFNARKTLLEVLKAAKEQDIIQRVPALDNPDEYEPVGRVLKVWEINELLWRARRPFRFIFYTFWKMGCRPREILQWRWDMIQWTRADRKFSYISIPKEISKTKRDREIALDPGVTRILKIRHRRGNGSEFVFPKRHRPKEYQSSYQSAWVTACRRAKVMEAMVYDFRRTFITESIDAGSKIERVARHLDTSPDMIRRFYLKDDEDAMEGLFTRATAS